MGVFKSIQCGKNQAGPLEAGAGAHKYSYISAAVCYIIAAWIYD